MFGPNQPVTFHIHRGLALFQDNVANQGFIRTIGRFHLNEHDLVEYRTETFNLNAYRAANFGPHNFLSCGFNLDLFRKFKNSESLLPGAG